MNLSGTVDLVSLRDDKTTSEAVFGYKPLRHKRLICLTEAFPVRQITPKGEYGIAEDSDATPVTHDLFRRRIRDGEEIACAAVGP